MTTRLLWIRPVSGDAFNRPIQDYLNSARQPDTEVDVVCLPRGPRNLESRYYQALVLPDTLALIRRAEASGYDAAIIGCFFDPGLWVAREITDRVVVTAPAEAAMHCASIFGRSFSVLIGREKWMPQVMENVIRYGFKDQLASMKAIGMGVSDFQKDARETARRLRRAAKEAINRDRAEVIILGCTLEFGLCKALQAELGVPVIDAVLAPLAFAEFLVGLRERFGWATSSACGFASPPHREVANFESRADQSEGPRRRREEGLT